MWDLIVSVPDHCLSLYFQKNETVVCELHDSKNRMLDISAPNKLGP